MSRASEKTALKIIRENVGFLKSSPLFWLGLVLKITFLFFLAGDIASQLFIPFFDTAVTHLGENPWSLSPPHSFPYGSFLFLIFLVPKMILHGIFGPMAMGLTPLSLLALKFPILFFDFICLIILGKFSGEQRTRLLALYWLNPALFYINYVHVQLDVVSVTLVLISLFLIIRKKAGCSGFVFGLATLSKFHVVAALPFILAFFWARNFRPQARQGLCKWIGSWALVTTVGFLPVLLAHNLGHVTVASPEIERLFSFHLVLSQQVTLYLGFLACLLVIGRLTISTRISDYGLVFGTGAIFGMLVLCSNAAPGWYFWILPFLALFFSLYANVAKLLFWGFSFLYCIHFGLLEWAPDFVSNFVASVSFSTLQGALLANILAIWIVMLNREASVERRASPLRIGIAGDSGTGKNRFTGVLQDIFGETNLSVLEGDNYHKWERGDQKWETYTHLNPKANHLFELSRHIRKISQGRPVFHSIYSHETGKFSSSVELRPSKTLVVQGLHTFYLSNMRDLFDLRVFLDPHPLLRMSWKIQRDCKERGSSVEKVKEQLRRREEDSAAYISAQADSASVIVQVRPAETFTEEQAEQGLLPKLSVRYLMWDEIDLHLLSTELESAGLNIKIHFTPEFKNRVVMEVLGDISKDTVKKIATKIFPALRFVTRSRGEPAWRSGLDGISQLVILWALNQNAETDT